MLTITQSRRLKLSSYNIRKFEKLQNRAKQLGEAARSAYEEKKYWHGKLKEAEKKIDHCKHVTRTPVTERMEIALEEAKVKYQTALDAHTEAQQRWQEIGSIVSRCENFLRDHGFKVGEQSLRITS